MNLPHSLIEDIKSQKAVLILGAGASLAASNGTGKHPPSGEGLRKLLCERFFGGEQVADNLALVASYAVTQTDLFTVQSYIKDVFSGFQPTLSHRSLGNFRWAGLVTTNYDLLIEEGYTTNSHALQKLIPWVENGERVVELQADPRNILLIKIHGCLTRINSTACPLILTRDQYAQYKQGRSRLFEKIKEWAYEMTFVFVGHGGSDADLTQTIYDLDIDSSARPRHYLIKPHSHTAEKQYWEQQYKLTILEGTFEDFTNAATKAIDPTFLAIPTISLPKSGLSNRIVDHSTLSNFAKDYIDSHVDYVKDCKGDVRNDPKDFYKGNNGEWDPIENNWDVQRQSADEILEEVFLVDDVRAKKPLEIVLIKGHAGSGKSILLRRLAWNASHDYDCLCIYLREGAPLETTAIREIVQKCKERLFIFLDNAADDSLQIRNFISDIGEDGELVTLILAARTNEWNLVPSYLESVVNKTYEVGNLSKSEIKKLIALLESHNALGRLEGKSFDEKVEAFEERAGRQLLVALHEATLGRQFSDILVDEYRSLVPLQAQQIYLTICVLNRLNVSVRAGIISRLHGITLDYFRDNLFSSLEHVVYINRDSTIRDYTYRARHPIIAGIVFDRILVDEREKFEEYYRALSALNLDYSSDGEAFMQMIKGRVISRLFDNQSYCEDIFELAQDMSPHDPHVMHQRAIYEISKQKPNFSLATSLLDDAIKLKSYYKPFHHTKAELALKRADHARSSLERQKYWRQALSLANANKDGRDGGSTHSWHTSAKVGIRMIEESLADGEDFSRPTIQSIVKNVENEISAGLQQNPGDSYLLTERAKLSMLLNDAPKMVKSLEEAFTKSPKLGYLAVQLADCYEAAGEIPKAREVLERALDSDTRADKHLNFRYASLLEAESNFADAAYYYRRSFTPGDSNFAARLMYARTLFLAKDFGSLREEINSYRSLRWAPVMREDQALLTPTKRMGRVNSIKSSYIFAIEEQSGLDVMIHNSQIKNADRLNRMSRVEFYVSFTFKGLSGIECSVI